MMSHRYDQGTHGRHGNSVKVQVDRDMLRDFEGLRAGTLDDLILDLEEMVAQRGRGVSITGMVMLKSARAELVRRQMRRD